MKINKEARRAARKLFKACFVNKRIEEQRIRSAVSAIATQKPRHYLEILTEIEKLASNEIQKFSLAIESATPLHENQLREIQSKIQARFPLLSTSSYRVNPKLIGGLRIKIGSNVWDGSVAARLQQLEVQN